MNDPEGEVDPLLTDARNVFSFFYDTASEEDVFAMDLLVLTAQNLAQNIGFPRRLSPPELCAGIERIGYLVELNFLDARRFVTESPTFQNLDCGHQQQIANALFSSPFSDQSGA